MSLLSTVSMILGLWGISPILGNGYGILGQYYIALFQGSEMSAGLHSRDLILNTMFMDTYIEWPDG